MISTGIRYNALIDAVERSGFRTVLDLTSGFYPTFLKLYNDGYLYRGADRPVVVQKMQPLTDRYTHGAVRLCSADVTNSDSVIKAAEDLNDPLCITNMSLLMYLQKFERDIMLKTIVTLLKERGGCWITPDPEAIPMYLDIAPIVFGIDLQKLIEHARKAYKDTPSAVISQTYNGTPDEQEAYFNTYGLSVEKVPILPDGRRFDMLYTLGSQKAAAIRTKLKDKNIWIMRYSDNEKTPATLKSADFECSRSISDQQLILTLAGRLDSLSSNDFQTYYDSLGGSGYNKILLDLKGLTFISSTWLRVIMHMIKTIGQDNISVTRVSDDVMDILRVTGFDSMLTII